MHNGAGYFYGEQEKKIYYSNPAITTKSYTHHTTLKVYQGADFLVYSYDVEGKLIVHTSVMVTGIQVENEGICLQFLDKKTYKIFKVGYGVGYFGSNKVLGHVPYRCYLERSVKETAAGQILEGLSGGLILMMKSDPRAQRLGHTYVIPHTSAHTYFYEGELETALEGGKG